MSQRKEWILVTGGSRGIGRGIVNLLAAEGYCVLFTYKSDTTSANKLVEDVTTNGGDVKAFQCDGSQYEDVEKLCSHLIATYGVPYGLVNNVGITGDQLIFDFDIDKYHDVIATNLNSCIYFNKYFIPAMAENKKGKVVHISSVSGIKGNKGQTSYAATKAAMIGITKTLALEASRFNITVNSVLPGFIKTEMVEKIDSKISSQIVKQIPLKRMGEVGEVAELVSFLISDKANYITGQSFIIDGGLTV